MPLLDLAYRQRALAAGHASTIIDEICLLEISGLAIYSNKVTQRAAALDNGSGQDDLQRIGYLDAFKRLADLHGVHDSMTQPTAGTVVLAQ